MFCSRLYWKVRYRKPWVAGGFRIASNGNAVAYSPINAADTPCNNEHTIPSDMLHYIGQCDDVDLPYTLGDVVAEPCPDCNGTLKSEVCSNCQDSGWTECASCGNETECNCDHQEKEVIDCDGCYGIRGNDEEGYISYALEGGTQIALEAAYLMSQLVGPVRYGFTTMTTKTNETHKLCVFQSNNLRGFTVCDNDE